MKMCLFNCMYTIKYIYVCKHCVLHLKSICTKILSDFNTFKFRQLKLNKRNEKKVFCHNKTKESTM